MRILLASQRTGHEGGGAESSVLATAEGLVNGGHEVVLAYDSQGDNFSRWTQVASVRRHIDLRYPSPLRHFARTTRAVRKARRVLRDTGPDIVYCNLFSELRVLTTVADCTGAPLVNHVRSAPPAYFRILYRPLLRRSRVVIFVSEYLARLYHEHGLADVAQTVVHEGVDTDRFRPPVRGGEA